MNWGKGIIIVMASFIVFISVLVVKLISTNVDLESEDYYAREINYSAEMEAIDRANELNDKISLSQSETHLILAVPENLEVQALELKLIRIENDKLDRLFQIKNNRNFSIAKADLVKGIYRIEINYFIDGVRHMQKDQIYL